MAVSTTQCPVCGVAIQMASIPNDYTPFICFRCRTLVHVVKADRVPIVVVSIVVAALFVVVTHLPLLVLAAITPICYLVGRFVQINIAVPKVVPSKVSTKNLPKPKKIHSYH